jgi:hypothetical protein
MEPFVATYVERSGRRERRLFAEVLMSLQQRGRRAYPLERRGELPVGIGMREQRPRFLLYGLYGVCGRQASAAAVRLMSGDKDDPLFSEEMVLRLYFNDTVWRALTTAHEVVHSACVTSSARTKILMDHPSYCVRGPGALVHEPLH